MADDQERVLSEQRVSEFVRLFPQFVSEYVMSADWQMHRALREQGRSTAAANWKEVSSAAAKGKDITDLVLLKLTPYVDSEANRARGAWIHVAPCSTGDLRRWYESAGWVKPQDWPQVSKSIYEFIRDCLENFVHFPEACARLRESSFSKGFQQGMLSPILNSLDPAHYLIMNGKSRRVMNYFADANFGEGIDEYPKANEALKRVIKVLGPHLQLPSDARMPVDDVFDAFCHWMVAMRKHPLRHTRYWKIAPGEDAWNWENCLREGYIAIGWDDFGDVSKMDRKAFLRKAEELIAANPKWNKVGLEQVWKFSLIKEGDVIIANKGTSEILGIGTVSGDYYFVVGEQHGHRLCVLWDDTRPRKINEGGWRRTLIELDRAKLEELLALPAISTAGGSFSPQAFELLGKLKDSPTRALYESQKSEFKKFVEEPLQQLLLQAGEQLPESMRIVLETRTSLFSRIAKNDFGHGGAWDFYWGALHPIGARRIESVQLFIIVSQNSLDYGFSLADYAASYRERFLLNWRRHGNSLRPILSQYLAQEQLLFGEQPSKAAERLSLLEWLKNPEKHGLRAAVSLTPKQAMAKSITELSSEMARMFQLLYPLVILAIAEEPLQEIQAFLEPDEEQEEARNPEFTLSQMAFETRLPEKELERWVTSIERKKHAVLYGPPGTGKTFVARKLAQYLVSGNDGFIELVQFHPSYAYEDFLQGIRPKTTVDGALSYTLQDGVFKRFCDRARSKSGRCVLIIDEINRANLSRVFGELMYLLEYRDKQIPLAYGGTFAIPENVYLLGTMNTADRSIALVDHALRRRFAFIRMAPNYEVLRAYHQDTGYEVGGLIQVLQELNGDIGEEDYHLGISYFLTKELIEHIEDIWRMEVQPYLEEYFFDHRDKARRYYWENIKNRISV